MKQTITTTAARLRRAAGLLLVAAWVAWTAGAAAHGPAGHDPVPAPQQAKASRPELGTSFAFAPDGGLYAAAKAGEHVLLYRSSDAGASWEAPVVVNAAPEPISADGENRPKLAFAADGGILVSWTKPLGKPYTGAIRLARSEDGRRFSAPITVHRDRSEITHRFDSLLVAGRGQVVIAWIDKRDLEAAKAGRGGDYRGAAIYVAVSDDHGRSFAPETKVADHSCECCRIALASDTDGLPLVLWRHVFEPNERDHALAKLRTDGTPEPVARATFDRWAVDACPHHGPSLAVAPDGTRHAVWFNQRDGAGRVFYGRLAAGSVEGQRTVGGERAAHGDLAVAGARVAVAWKEFDGERTRLWAEVSADGGRSFKTVPLAETEGASDQPRVLRRGEELFAFWRTADEGMKGYRLP